MNTQTNIIEPKKEWKSQLLTIPNLLSLIRLAMIPVIICLYCIKQEAVWTAVLLVLSGATDLVDGYIARRFNQITDIGKALDPIADKLTQLAMLWCLVTNHPRMIVPFLLLLAKEIITGIMSLIVIKKTTEVNGADWHGKICTVMLYGMMVLHVLWPQMPSVFSLTTIVACVVMMIFSFVMYGRRNLNALKATNPKA